MPHRFHTAGIDVGSTYTKAIILDSAQQVVGQAMRPTGYKLAKISETVYHQALHDAGLAEADVHYIVATGFGRHQVPISDVKVTDLTAGTCGATFLYPGSRTLLDVGGQTMKAIRIGDDLKVHSFRLNDKCAAGTGAFLEKTARYMGFSTKRIGPLLAASTQEVPISGVCAVFAESEVINHLSEGKAPEDILHGAVVSLVGRSVQLMKRVRMQPEYTLIGGLFRFPMMADLTRKQLGLPVNVHDTHLVQYVPALGVALLGLRRLRKLGHQEGDHVEPSKR